METGPDVLRFGIPSLDRLLGHPEAANGDKPRHGVALEGHATVVCIIGTGGTGKSELALHLASRYVADVSGESHPPRAFYVSTDLSHGTAHSIWCRFRLDEPNDRKNPLDDTDYRPRGLKVSLDDSPIATSADIDKLTSKRRQGLRKATVAFIDLHRSACEDELATLTHLVKKLKETDTGPKHLLIIDAARGLDTLVGQDQQVAGEESTRSRVRSLLFWAQNRCHVVFVVEASERDDRSHEVSISDLVVRLRMTAVNGYQRRTVAIEKLRGQPYVRGEHPIKFRSGRGSKTVRGDIADVPEPVQRCLENQDGPEVPDDQSSESTAEHLPAQRGHQSYIQVYPSLDAANRFWTKEAPSSEGSSSDGACARFGVAHLDDLLVHTSDQKEGGLLLGSIAALIGEPGTHKVRLSRAFLGGALSPLRSYFSKDGVKSSIVKVLRRKDPKFTKELDQCGASVLVTTSDTDVWQLAQLFSKSLLPTDASQRDEAVELLARHIAPRIVCRRLELHDLPAPVLLDIVMSAVRRRPDWRISAGDDIAVRLVLEDLRIWREIYFDLEKEPFFLPVLFSQLRRANVTTLVVDGSFGQPEADTRAQVETELRFLADPRLHTWRVPFYGDSRVAIAVVPPPSGDPNARGQFPTGRVLVRELYSELDADGIERPVVDPHFELYKGIQAGRPEPVPLEICLFSETAQVQSYIATENRFLAELFNPFQSAGVIRPVAMEDYKILRDWCRGQPETQLEHTRLLQVDEFWLPSGRAALRSQRHYLTECTWRDGKPDEIADPYRLFPPKTDETEWKRCQSFQGNLGYGLEILGGASKNGQKTDRTPSRASKSNQKIDRIPSDAAEDDRKIDRIPFTWDFGFLLCKVEPWEQHRAEAVPSWYREYFCKTVGDVWDRLPHAWGQRDGTWGEGNTTKRSKSASEPEGPRPSWREFFGACKAISDASSTKNSSKYLPFDVSLPTSESFACFVLEVWMSEMLLMVRAADSTKLGKSVAEVEAWLQSLSERQWRQSDHALRLFSQPDCFPRDITALAFFRTWLLLIDVLDLAQFASPTQPFEPVSRQAKPESIATRYWYKMACAAQQRDSDTVTVATGLPGSFSVRGDWFLGVAHESRSWRLADRALDFLSSRRANFERMQFGMGLPTRSIADEHEAVVRTLLKGPPQRPPKGNRGAACGQRGPMMNVSYASVKALGQRKSQSDFRWLWRSAFKDYDPLNAIWQKSLARLAIAWDDFKRMHQQGGVSGLELYDLLNQHGQAPLRKEWWSHEKRKDLSQALENGTSSDRSTGDVVKQTERQLFDGWRKLQASVEMIRQLFQEVAIPPLA